MIRITMVKEDYRVELLMHEDGLPEFIEKMKEEKWYAEQ